jgi:hypothetical protein
VGQAAGGWAEVVEHPVRRLFVRGRVVAEQQVQAAVGEGVELLERGYDVRTTVRSVAKADAVRKAVATEVEPKLDFAVVDLTSDDGWRDAVEGCDHVLHVASPLGVSGQESLIEPAGTAHSGCSTPRRRPASSES